jgi:hypothetical protein
MAKTHFFSIGSWHTRRPKYAAAPTRQQFFPIKKYYFNIKLHHYPQPNQQLTKKKKKPRLDHNITNPNELNLFDLRVHV